MVKSYMPLPARAWSLRHHITPWSWEGVEAACLSQQVDYSALYVACDGLWDSFVAAFFKGLDADMLLITQAPSWTTLRTHEKVKACLMERLRLLNESESVMSLTYSYLNTPTHWPLNLQLLNQTVDTIWYACGDTATDFNYYTKRGLLAIVQALTFRHWIKGERDLISLERHLDQYLRHVSQIPKLKQHAMNLLEPGILRVKGITQKVFR